MSPKIPLIVASKFELFRKALISHLKYLDNKIQVIGEAGSPTELFELLKVKQPQVLLVNFEIPVTDGIEILTNIKKNFPAISTIILGTNLEETLIAHYMSNGALACLSKNCDSDTLLDAIYTVKARQPYLSKSTSFAVLNALKAERKINTLYSKLRLSSREIEVLRQICMGHTTNQISKSLNVAPVTVDFHKKNLFQKTGTNNSIKLAIYAVKSGIFQL